MIYIYVTRGLPASGKTTWAKEKVKEDQGTTVRVNKDNLREMMFAGKFSKDRENSILEIRDHIVERAIFENRNVIVDDTNFKDKHIDSMKNIVNKFDDVEVQVVDFNTDVYTCLERNRNREDSVPEYVIWQMYFSYVFQPIEIEQNDLPKAYIVDVDGTLGYNTTRHPYDYTKVEEDAPNTPVINLISELGIRNHIIIVTGRENVTMEDGSTTRIKTKNWLDKHNIPYDTVLIRQEGDHRKDAVVKREIYDHHIKNQYNILGVFDDRQQTIHEWRRIGLQVYDVNGHTF